MSSIASVLLTTSMVLGQADQSSAYEHLKELEWLVGHAVGEYTTPQGWIDDVPVGTKIVRRSSTRWALNRSILFIELTETIEGRPPEKWLEIVGWDPDKKQIVHWLLNPGGGSGSGVWSKVGDGWQLKWKSQFGGSHYSGIGVMKVTGNDSFSWGITDAKKDGNPIADIPVTECKMTDTAEASGLPAKSVKFLANIVGEWSIEGTAGGEQVTGEVEFVWAPERQCVEYRGSWDTPEGRISTSGLSGWNPAKKQIVNTEYWTGGGQNVLHYTVVSEKVWEGTMAGVDQEGLTTGGQIRVEMKGPDKFVFTAKKVFKGDQVERDQELVFRRKSQR